MNGPNCADCAHVIDGLPDGGLLCAAPQLKALLDDGNANDIEPVQCARSFRCACGIPGRWFMRRVKGWYSYMEGFEEFMASLPDTSLSGNSPAPSRSGFLS